jgi:hypothetical protein
MRPMLNLGPNPILGPKGEIILPKRPVVIKASGGIVMTRLGRRFGYFAVPWFFETAILHDLMTPTPWAALPAWAQILGVLVPCGPGIIWLLAASGLRRGPFASLVEATQPSATIGPLDLELCLPAAGCRRYDWSAVGSLQPIIETRRQRLLRMSPMSNAVLRDRMDRPIATLPSSLVLGREPGWRARGLSFVDVVVEMRPDLFGFADGGSLVLGPSSFSRLEDLRVDHDEIERVIRRRDTITRGMIVASVVAVIVGSLVALGALSVFGR